MRSLQQKKLFARRGLKSRRRSVEGSRGATDGGKQRNAVAAAVKAVWGALCSTPGAVLGCPHMQHIRSQGRDWVVGAAAAAAAVTGCSRQ